MYRLNILGENEGRVKTPSDASPYYRDAIAVTSMLARLRLKINPAEWAGDWHGFLSEAWCF